MRIVGWEFVDPSIGAAIAVMGLKVPFENRLDTNTHTAVWHGQQSAK